MRTKHLGSYTVRETANRLCNFGERVEDVAICGAPAVKRIGSSLYCLKHCKFFKMVSGARETGKAVPTFRQLELLTPHDMRCVHCGVEMAWSTSKGEPRGHTVSLQHYLDGTFGLICLVCNTRHGKLAHAMGDDGFARTDVRYCSICKTIKPLDAFYDEGRRSGCLDCLRERNRLAVKARRRREKEAAT